MRSSDLSARFACQDLMIESYRLVDEGNASDVTRLFTDDGEFLIEGIAAISGRESLSEFFQARKNDQTRQTKHCLTNLYFNLTAANEATIHATLLLFVLGSEDATIPEAVAEVEDRYRREGETWRIAARRTTPLAGGR